jgi:hypothetical protein
MKKLILASALLMVTAGCTQGTKSGSPSKTTGQQAQQQNPGASQDLSAAEAAQQAQQTQQAGDDGVVDSVARQDALKDLTLKLYESTARLQMHLDSALITDSDSNLLREFLAKKFSPKGQALLEGLSSGDIKSPVTLTDLQISVADKDLQFKALIMGFKKLSAAAGFTPEQQATIEKSLITNQSLIAPNTQERNRIVAVSQHISKKAKVLISVMHDNAQDESVCSGLGYFVSNLNALLTDSRTFKLPQTISELAQPLEPILKSLDTCSQDIPGMRKKIADDVLGLIARMDKAQGMINKFLDPSIKDTDPLFLDIADRWAILETKEILEKYKIPLTGEIDIDGVVCNIDGTDYDAVMKTQDDNESTAEIKFESLGEKPFSVRKAKGQRGVTVSYISSQRSIANGENSNIVNAGEGSVGAVFSMVPGDTEAMKLTLKKEEGKDATMAVVCHPKQ